MRTGIGARGIAGNADRSRNLDQSWIGSRLLMTLSTWFVVLVAGTILILEVTMIARHFPPEEASL